MFNCHELYSRVYQTHSLQQAKQRSRECMQYLFSYRRLTNLYESVRNTNKNTTMPEKHRARMLGSLNPASDEKLLCQELIGRKCHCLRV